MKQLLCTCPFVPVEWIFAHGFICKRSVPFFKNLGSVESMGCCPLAQAFLDEIISTRLPAIFSSTCDQMRRAADVAKAKGLNVFIINVPTTISEESVKYFRSELLRLSLWLESLGGKRPTNKELRACIEKFNDARSLVLDSQPYVSGSFFMNSVMNLAAETETGIIKKKNCVFGSDQATRVPLAILGGHTSQAHFGLINEIEKAGGRIVLNALSFGNRVLIPKIIIGENEDIVYGIAKHYMENIRDVFMRPNDRFYSWLTKEIKTKKVKGAILATHVWCDLWRGEIQTMKEILKIPLLDITFGTESFPLNQTINRCQSFLEMMQ
jgi:benzoyl-CoA reductase/2-hydroxyglutaryl-CoA dehydratase subunit BcrC/BadD/HgdB